MFKPGQLLHVNLAGMQVQGVLFHAAVTDAMGNIVKQTSEDPLKGIIEEADAHRVELSRDFVDKSPVFTSEGKGNLVWLRCSGGRGERGGLTKPSTLGAKIL